MCEVAVCPSATVPDRMPGDGIDAELLDRYLARECSEAEDAIVRRYLMARPELAMALASFLAELEDERVRPAPPDARESWMRLRGRLRETEGDLLPVPGGSPRSRQITDTKPRHLFSLLPSRRNSSGWRRIMYTTVAAGLVVVAVFRVVRKDTIRRSPRRPRKLSPPPIESAPSSGFRMEHVFVSHQRAIFGSPPTTANMNAPCTSRVRDISR